MSNTVSVVVCVKNRAGSLPACLETIRAADPLEIIVVDGMSTDGSAEVAAGLADKVVFDQGAGLAAARQLGAETAAGEYVAYVDSDVRLTPGCLDQLTEALSQDATLAAVHARIEALASGSYWSRSTQARMDLLQEYAPGEKNTLGCMAVVIRRDLILKHRFDPFFVGASEDEDFYLRLRAAGWRLACIDSVAYHIHRQSLAEGIKQRIWYGRGAVRLAVRGHPKSRVGLLVHPLKLIGIVFLWRALKAGRPGLIPYICLESGAQYAGETLEATSLISAWLRQHVPFRASGRLRA